MANAEILNASPLRRSYVANLLAATALGTVASASLWIALNKESLPVVWHLGAATACFLALWLTIRATRTGRRMARLAAFAGKFEAAGTVDTEGEGEPSATRTRLVDTIVESLRRPAETVRAEAAKSKEEARGSVGSERERLRKAGFSEAEISQILVARESGQGGGLFSGQSVLSGVASNVKAVADYLRGLVPSVRADLANMFDHEASAATRLSGTLSLTAKGVAAVVFGYFVYLEALQLRSQAYKSWAEACIERQKNAINFSTMYELMSPDGPTKKLDKECRGM